MLMTIATILNARGDEGMWLFNQPPVEILRERHQFEATPEWLGHLQRASVRFNSGGSGSFVSPDGLIITNHHVAAGELQKLSDKDRDLLRDGFRARTRAEELPCPGLELNVLQSIEDVTARVNAAVPDDTDPAAAFAARRKIIADIEKESLDQTGLRSNVITLWKGAAYHLYRFKRYTDVRVVFAPERQIAYFGGDVDNFEFPRYDLDVCFFRAYEDGKPARVQDWLTFSREGAKEGDLVFVSGHPGHTDRLLTVAELKALRDQSIPFSLALLKRREVLFSTWSARGVENARRAQGDLFGVQNSRKALDGRLAGLLDPELFAQKVRDEEEFKGRLPADAKARAAYDTIATAAQTLSAQAVRRSLLEGGSGLGCDSFYIARDLLRAGDELPKPNGERLEEFADSEKASFELGLFSPEPIYADLEILKLADALTFLSSQLGAEDPLVQKILAGQSPRDRAAALVNGTKVRDVAFRKQLYEGGAAAVAAANDPMVELARLVDAESRALRKTAEEQGEVKEEAHAEIDRARNQILGATGYPDATFTLRLAFGTVKGWEQDGAAIPAMTTFGGLFQRTREMGNRPPYDLPESWAARGAELDPATPFNFVSTADITGGNSGSPVVNRDGKFVGIIFDGNLPSLSWAVAYDARQGRATSVHSAAILAALDKIYGMKDLIRELEKPLK